MQAFFNLYLHHVFISCTVKEEKYIYRYRSEYNV